MLSWRTASETTQSPISTMRPVSSATGMKSSGWIMPMLGCAQRSNASTPTTAQVSRSTIGW